MGQWWLQFQLLQLLLAAQFVFIKQQSKTKANFTHVHAYTYTYIYIHMYVLLLCISDSQPERSGPTSTRGVEVHLMCEFVEQKCQWSERRTTTRTKIELTLVRLHCAHPSSAACKANTAICSCILPPLTNQPAFARMWCVPPSCSRLRCWLLAVSLSKASAATGTLVYQARCCHAVFTRFSFYTL